MHLERTVSNRGEVLNSDYKFVDRFIPCTDQLT